jgi:hypothetical protein
MMGLKIIVLTIVMFTLFTIGANLFTADSAMAQQMSPEEAAVAGSMLIVVSFIDTLILTYFILRSRLCGLRLMVTVSLVFYGVKTFLSIIEAWWFMDTVSIGEIPGLFLMTVPMALLFPVVAVWVLGKHKISEDPDETPNSRLEIPRGQFVWKVLFLAAIVYPMLFWTFGYYVAFSNPELVAYYGATHPGSFLAQMRNVWADDPFVFLFEIFRGALWVALALLVIRNTNGRVWQAGLITALLFSLVQNNVHLIPGAMPPSVRLSHFIESSTSNAIFAVIITWLMHRAHSSVRDLFRFNTVTEIE